MDVIRPYHDLGSLDEYHLTYSDIKQLVDNHPEIPDDCRVLVQQIDEDFKDDWIDTKWYVLNADPSIVGEYWQAWAVYYHEEKNILLIHLHY